MNKPAADRAKLPDAKKAAVFYSCVLKILQNEKIPFMVGGTYALNHYTGLNRETHDLDLFGKASDYPKFLEALKNNKFCVELVDERWLAKATKGDLLVDFIFNSPSSLCPVNDSWLKYAITTNFLELDVKMVPPEELIWSKIYFQERTHYDGADVNHLILKQGKHLNWKRLMLRMEAHWEVLLSQLINYRFVYPSEKENIPKFVLKELVDRLNQQLNLPSAHDKVCRGPLLARVQYAVDINEWGFQVVT